MKQIKYRDGFKYQLAEDYHHKLGFKLPNYVDAPFYAITESGRMIIHAGYAWNGPSGIAFDTPNFMRGSLVHDLGYECLRRGLIPMSFRQAFDEEMYKICLEDGMSKMRAWWCFRAVRRFAVFAADPKNKRKIHTAPEHTIGTPGF